MISLYEKKLFLTIARETIEQFFTKKTLTERTLPPILLEKGSSFVTLIKNNKLQGCYGTIFPFQSLVKDIQTNAFQAAFLDPRFPPVSEQDLSTISIELSILSSPSAIQVTTEKELLEILHPHVDGVVLQWKEHKSTFLPVVWSSFSKKEDFVTALKIKAGLPKDFWEKDMEIFTYTACSWKE